MKSALLKERRKSVIPSAPLSNEVIRAIIVCGSSDLSKKLVLISYFDSPSSPINSAHHRKHCVNAVARLTTTSPSTLFSELNRMRAASAVSLPVLSVITRAPILTICSSLCSIASNAAPLASACIRPALPPPAVMIEPRAPTTTPFSFSAFHCSVDISPTST